MAPQLPTTRLVYLADREADIMDLMVRARDLDTPVDWLLRCRHNRTLSEGDKLWLRVTSGEPVGEIRFTLAQRQGQRAREVVQLVWAPSGAIARWSRWLCAGHLPRRQRNGTSRWRQACRMAAADEPACGQPGAGCAHD